MSSDARQTGRVVNRQAHRVGRGSPGDVWPCVGLLESLFVHAEFTEDALLLGDGEDMEVRVGVTDALREELECPERCGHRAWSNVTPHLPEQTFHCAVVGVPVPREPEIRGTPCSAALVGRPCLLFITEDGERRAATALMAKSTPPLRIGSVKQAASPTIIQPGPANWLRV